MTLSTYNFVFIGLCSYGEQIRDVRHKCYFISIRNLLSRFPFGWHMLSASVSAWTGLDPRGVTCEENSDAQVSKEFSEKSNLVIKGLMNAYL